MTETVGEMTAFARRKMSICSTNSPIYLDIREPLAECLRARGYEVRFTQSPDTDAGVLLVVGNLRWFPDVQRRLLRTPQSDRPLVVLWHTEPLPTYWRGPIPWPPPSARRLINQALHRTRANDGYGNFLAIRRADRAGLVDLVLVPCMDDAAFLRRGGVRCQHVPFGYHPRLGENLARPRDIDVLFLGTLASWRRQQIIVQLRRRGVEVTQLGSWRKEEFLSGRDRTELLNRAKIFLDIHRVPGSLNLYRFLLGMANGAAVLSEPHADPHPFLPGTDYIAREIAEWPDTISHLLRDENARARIADSGHQLVTHRITMQQSVERILDLVTEHLA